MADTSDKIWYASKLPCEDIRRVVLTQEENFSSMALVALLEGLREEGLGRALVDTEHFLFYEIGHELFRLAGCPNWDEGVEELGLPLGKPGVAVGQVVSRVDVEILLAENSDEWRFDGLSEA